MLDVIDRALMDLVSVYRDAIALSVGAPGLLVNEELRGDVQVVARAASPEELLRMIDAIFTAREQMLEFNVPPQLALESMTVALRLPGGRLMKKAVAVIAVLALALTAFVAVGLAIQGGTPDSPAARADPVADDTAAGSRSPRRRPRSWPTSTRSASTGSPARPTATTTAAPSPCRSTTPTRRGETIDLALLAVPATGSRVGSLVVNPGGPGARGTTYAAAGGAGVPRAAARRLRHRRLRPARHRRARPGRLPQRRRARRLPRPSDPTPDTPAEVADYERSRAVLRRRAARRLRRRSSATSTTIEAARDMDVLRAALGEEQLTYFGASYGTKLGATYAELFPDEVGRFVLDGAVDVSLDTRRRWRSSRPPGSRPRCAPTCRTASTRPTTASSATPSTRAWPRSPTCSTRSRRSRCPRATAS